jgi:aryl-alcohol dehydrogenase-like predicted oxidoreductase
VESGVNHIDTSDYYGPHITNQIIREALKPYPDDLVIVTKIGARRGEDGSWIRAASREALTQAVHDHLRNLEFDVLDVVNFRSMLGVHKPAEGSIEEPLTVLVELQQQGFGPSHWLEQRDGCANRRGPRNPSDRLRAEHVQPGAS